MNKQRLQELYNHTITEIGKATANEQIEEAAGNMMTWYTGKRLAYADVARRLVDLGCRKPVTDNPKLIEE